MFWGTKFSANKISYFIKQTRSTIMRAISKVRMELFFKLSKNHFEKQIGIEYIKHNTTNYSKCMLKILSENAIILVVDGTLLKTNKPS